MFLFRLRHKSVSMIKYSYHTRQNDYFEIKLWQKRRKHYSPLLKSMLNHMRLEKQVALPGVSTPTRNARSLNE